MSQGYSDEPITFNNIITNRPNNEIIENLTLLTHFFYDSSLDISEIYFQHNDVQATDDIFYKGMIVSLNTFFTPEKEEELREYIKGFREKKFNNTQDNDEEKDDDDDDKIELLDENDIITNFKCTCEFCNIFNNAENILETHKHKNVSELLLIDILKSNAPKEYINKVYLNPINYT